MSHGCAKATPLKTNPHYGSFRFAGGKVCHRVWLWRSSVSLNRKTWWAEIITFYSRGSLQTIGWWKAVSLGGRSSGFTQSVLLSFTFRYSPTHEYELSGRLKESDVPVIWDSIATWDRRAKASQYCFSQTLTLYSKCFIALHHGIEGTAFQIVEIHAEFLSTEQITFCCDFGSSLFQRTGKKRIRWFGQTFNS